MEDEHAAALMLSTLSSTSHTGAVSSLDTLWRASRVPVSESEQTVASSVPEALEERGLFPSGR